MVHFEANSFSVRRSRFVLLWSLRNCRTISFFFDNVNATLNAYMQPYIKRTSTNDRPTRVRLDVKVRYRQAHPRDAAELCHVLPKNGGNFLLPVPIGTRIRFEIHNHHRRRWKMMRNALLSKEQRRQVIATLGEAGAKCQYFLEKKT